MRKLTLLLTLLLLCALPALAETPALDESLVGEWTPALEVWYNGICYYKSVEVERCVITEDGQLLFNYLGEAPHTLVYNDATGHWSVQDDERLLYCDLYTDSYGHLIIDAFEHYVTLVLLPPDATPAALPPLGAGLSCAGTWELTSLFFPEGVAEGLPAFLVDPASLGIPPVTLTLGAFPDTEEIDQAFRDAVDLQAPGTPLDRMEIYFSIRFNADTLLLDTFSGMLLLTRTATPEVDEAILPHAQQLANWWRLDAPTVGGVPLSPDAFDAEDFPLAIDELGFARLGDAVHQLQLEGDTILLNGVPLRYDGHNLCIEIADGVELRYITESDWYRAQLNGTWQLSGVEIPVMEFWEDDAADAQLIITADDTAVLRHSAGELRFTLQRTDDVLTYHLVDAAGDIRLLTIRSLNALTITTDSEAYSLSFAPAE